MENNLVIENPGYVVYKICEFINRKLNGKNAILGLSGGIDSALVLALLNQSVSQDQKIICVAMPARKDNPNTRDAFELAERYGVYYCQAEVWPMLEAYFGNKIYAENELDDHTRLRIGNFAARMRMATLYDFSYQYNGLVVGTGNRTEELLGYTTMYGDNAFAFNPIGDLWKTQVRQLAKYLGVPDKIINKPPSADLWIGQTDEGEIGITYEEMDNILISLCNKERIVYASQEKLAHTIHRRIKNNRFKSQLPEIVRISNNNYFPESYLIND